MRAHAYDRGQFGIRILTRSPYTVLTPRVTGCRGMITSSTDYASNVEPGSYLQAGTAAPDFSLRSTPDQTVSLNDFPAGR